MTNIQRFSAADLDKLMDRITRDTIGMDKYLNRLFTHEAQSSYPPYNLVNIDDNTFRVEVALAGFKDDEIKVYTQDSKLTVVGRKDEKADSYYIHRGLAQRSFTRSWALSEDTEVTDVTFEHGLLSVTLTRVVPEKYQKHIWFGSEE
tara:strand:+ start:36 stop:476 length:441 start_codon:yes stop_codon:yes gene_type:complete